MTAYKKDHDTIKALEDSIRLQEGVVRAARTDVETPRFIDEGIARIDKEIERLYAERAALVNRRNNAKAVCRKAVNELKRRKRRLKSLKLQRELDQHRRLAEQIAELESQLKGHTTDDES